MNLSLRVPTGIPYIPLYRYIVKNNSRFNVKNRSRNTGIPATNERLRGTLGLRRKLVVDVKNPTPIPIPHSETEPRHVVTNSDPFVASSVHRTMHRTRNERVGVCARNSQREGRSLSRHVGYLFLSVGWGSAWGSSRQLQVLYVIPGSRVIVHISLQGAVPHHHQRACHRANQVSLAFDIRSAGYPVSGNIIGRISGQTSIRYNL